MPCFRECGFDSSGPVSLCTRIGGIPGWARDAAFAVQRVAERVRQGGHHIPEATIRRRFHLGLRLFGTVYQSLVDEWMLFDNAGDEPILLKWGVRS